MSVFATASGLIDLAFGTFHVLFWRLLDWPDGLKGSGRINAAITQTLNAVLIYTFFAYGGAVLWLGGSGGAPSLLLVAGAGFWILRSGLQPLLFPMGNRVSAILFVLFLMASATHLLAAIVP